MASKEITGKDSKQDIHFDGIYFSFKDNIKHIEVGNVRANSIPTSYFLKFYQDGQVIFGVIACNNILEDIPLIIRWFNRDWEQVSRAEYQRQGKKVHFCFDDRLIFDGKVLRDGTIKFKIRNLYNKNEWEEQFAFWAVSNG